MSKSVPSAPSRERSRSAASTRAPSAAAGQYGNEKSLLSSPHQRTVSSGIAAPRTRDKVVAPAGRGTARTATAGAGKTADGAAGPESRPLDERRDDPLAPARTRWLSEVVGGGARLAEMLGVSASQTSRWASGKERPGPRSAPLLIDLEHVLARVRLVWAAPAATNWMLGANAYLDGARPIDVLTLKGPGPVLDALDAAAWGGAA